MTEKPSRNFSRGLSAFQKYVSVINEDIMKGKELYENEIDNLEINKIKKQLDNLPKEELLKYLMERMNK